MPSHAASRRNPDVEVLSSRDPRSPGAWALATLLLIGATLLGLSLAYSLAISTRPTSEEDLTLTPEGNAQPLLDAAGIPVIDESTLGAEAQAIVLGLNVAVQLDFDLTACLASQGVSEPALAIEEIRWIEPSTRAWLVVHSDRDADAIRAQGGDVGVIVVPPQCGTGDEGDALWQGSALLAPTTG